MKFWFCEKCNKRLTEADLGAEWAAEQASVVYCKECAASALTAVASAKPAEKNSFINLKPPSRQSKPVIEPLVSTATTRTMPVAAPTGRSGRISRPNVLPPKPPSDRDRKTTVDSGRAAQTEPPHTVPVLPIAGAIAAVVIIVAAVLLGTRPASTPSAHAVMPSNSPAPAVLGRTPGNSIPAPPDRPSGVAPPQPALPNSLAVGKADPDRDANAAFDTLEPLLKAMDKDQAVAALEQFIGAYRNSIVAARARRISNDIKNPLPPEVAKVTLPSAAPKTPVKSAPTGTATPVNIVVVAPDPAEAARATLAASNALQTDLLRSLENRDGERARAVLAQAEKVEALAAKKNEIAALKPVADWLTEIDAALPRGIGHLNNVDDFTLPVAHGTPIHVGKSAEFKFKELKDDEIRVGNDNLTLSVPLNSLPNATRDQLAMLAIGDGPHGQVVQAFIDFIAAPDKQPKSLAEVAGVSAADNACLLQLAAVAGAQTGERAAEAALKELRSLPGDKHDALRAGLETFHKAYADTAYISAHAADLANLEVLSMEPDPKGLITHLTFDDLEGTIFPDTSGQNHAGVAVNGPQPAPGKYKNALSFNGAEQYVTLPDDLLHVTKEMTVSLWINTTSCGTLIGYQDTAAMTVPARYINILYVGTSGRLRGRFPLHDQAMPSKALTAPINDGKWHHIAITTQKDGGPKKDKQNLYVDGVNIATYSGTLEKPTGMHYQLGTGWTDKWTGGNTKWFHYKGLLDDFRVYERALSEQEVALLAGKKTE